MTQPRKRIRLVLAALVVAGFLALAPTPATAQYVVHAPVARIAPVPVFHGTTHIHYSPSTSSYYVAPVVRPAVLPRYRYSFYAPRRVTYVAPPVTYVAPTVHYYTPVYNPPSVTTTYYRPAILPRRRALSTTTYYYTPAFFRY